MSYLHIVKSANKIIFQYEDTAPDFFHMAEGRCVNVGGTYVYEYMLRDHVGSVRAAFDVVNDSAEKARGLLPATAYSIVLGASSGKANFYDEGGTKFSISQETLKKIANE